MGSAASSQLLSATNRWRESSQLPLDPTPALSNGFKTRLTSPLTEKKEMGAPCAVSRTWVHIRWHERLWDAHGHAGNEDV